MRGDTKTVMIHGEREIEGGKEHADFNSPDATSFNVWLRVDYCKQNPLRNIEPFTSVERWDADFTSMAAAQLYADALAEFQQCDIEKY